MEDLTDVAEEHVERVEKFEAKVGDKVESYDNGPDEQKLDAEDSAVTITNLATFRNSSQFARTALNIPSLHYRRKSDSAG